MDKDRLFSQTYRTLASKTIIPKEDIESLSYGLSVCRTDENKDNSFIVDLIIKGAITKDEYFEIIQQYSSLFHKPINNIFGDSDSISSGRLVYYAMDLSSAARTLKFERDKNSKPDYFDQLSEIKSSSTGKWFHTSH